MSIAVQPPIPPVYRHPLGLPAGSIRAILALLIVGQFCIFLVLPAEKARPVPLYLHGLMLMVMLYFVARGKDRVPGESPQPSPLYLPRYFVRGILFLGLVGVVAWQLYQAPEVVRDRLTPVPSQISDWPYIFGTLGASFVLGRLLRMGPWRNSAWFQDILAWVSLLAMIALVAELCFSMFVSAEFFAALDRRLWECILTGIVTTYFAART